VTRDVLRLPTDSDSRVRVACDTVPGAAEFHHSVTSLHPWNPRDSDPDVRTSGDTDSGASEFFTAILAELARLARDSDPDVYASGHTVPSHPEFFHPVALLRFGLSLPLLSDSDCTFLGIVVFSTNENRRREKTLQIALRKKACSRWIQEAKAEEKSKRGAGA